VPGVPGAEPADRPAELLATAMAGLADPGLVVLAGGPGVGRSTALRRLGEAFRGPVFAGGGLAMLRGVPAFALARAVKVRLPAQGPLEVGQSLFPLPVLPLLAAHQEGVERSGRSPCLGQAALLVCAGRVAIATAPRCGAPPPWRQCWRSCASRPMRAPLRMAKRSAKCHRAVGAPSSVDRPYPSGR